jgi:hypothetical protein
MEGIHLLFFYGELDNGPARPEHVRDTVPQLRYPCFSLPGWFALTADKMYTVDAQTAEDFALAAEHKWTVFVINWHMECTDFKMCIISFDERNFSVLLAAQFRSSGNALTSIRGRVAWFESPPGHNRQLLCGLT